MGDFLDSCHDSSKASKYMRCQQTSAVWKGQRVDNWEVRDEGTNGATWAIFSIKPYETIKPSIVVQVLSIPMIDYETAELKSVSSSPDSRIIVLKCAKNHPHNHIKAPHVDVQPHFDCQLHSDHPCFFVFPDVSCHILLGVLPATPSASSLQHRHLAVMSALAFFLNQGMFGACFNHVFVCGFLLTVFADCASNII